MEYAVHEDGLIIVIKVNGVRESLDEDAAKGIKTNRVVGGVFRNQVVCPLQFDKKISAQTFRLLLVPLICVRRVNYRFG